MTCRWPFGHEIKYVRDILALGQVCGLNTCSCTRSLKENLHFKVEMRDVTRCAVLLVTMISNIQRDEN